MDTRTGNIYTQEQVDAMAEKDKIHIKQMVRRPTKQQTIRKPPRVGRNEPCPCGSGKKFKRCCLEAKS